VLRPLAPIKSGLRGLEKSEVKTGIKMKLLLNSPKQKTAALLLVLALVLFVLEQVGALAVLQAPLQRVLLPGQLALYKTKQDFEGFLATITEIGSLRKKENELLAENALLAAENARLKKLESENKILREQLGARQEKRELIIAQVIGQDPLFSGSKLLVDKGRDSNVVSGALVVLKDILIGQVVRVGASTSTVRLLTDPRTKIPAVTGSGVKGILQGEFGSRVVLEEVVQGEKLNPGEIVYTLGEADFPKGLVLGKITQVENNPAALFQKASVEPLLSFKSLETVFIVKGPK